MPVNFKHGLTQPLFNKNSEEKREKIIKYFNSHNYDIICLNDVPLFKDGLHMNYEGHEMMSEEVLKKIINNDLKMKIINFNNFDDLYDFCNMLFNNKINIKDFCKKNSLYSYNNIYYLVLENIDITQINFKKFNSYISEFSTYKSYSKNFEYKLKEHGKLIINKNAVNKIFNIFT